jgi:hypothetical protein
LRIVDNYKATGSRAQSLVGCERRRLSGYRRPAIANDDRPAAMV